MGSIIHLPVTKSSIWFGPYLLEHIFEIWTLLKKLNTTLICIYLSQSIYYTDIYSVYHDSTKTSVVKQNWNSNVLPVDSLIDSAVEYIDALLFMIFLDYPFFRLLFSKFLHKNKENGLNKQWFIVIQNSQWTKFVTRYEPLIKCIISHSMIDNKRLEKIIERWWFIGFFIEARATEPIKLRPLSLDDFELEMIDVIPTYLNRFENIQVLRFEFE